MFKTSMVRFPWTADGPVNARIVVKARSTIITVPASGASSRFHSEISQKSLGELLCAESSSIRSRCGLLLYLADNAGRVIALQELLDAVWPNVVVTPQSVYNTVAQLRRTLGDLADAPTYIANIPRKGYRLIAKVEHRQVERRAAPAAMPPATVIPPSAARAPNAAPPPTSPGLVNVDAPPSRVGPSRVFLIGSLALALIGLLALVLARQGVLGRRSASTEAVVDHSVAVLPFRDLSAAQDRAYLAEGLAEQIGTVLSGVPKLRVVGRASAFASRSASIPDIAKKLHVDHVLEGSVQSFAARRPN